MSGFASIAKNGGAGGSSTTNAASTTQFGETLVAQLNPSSQATFVNGLNPTLFISRSIGTGATTTAFSGSAFLNSGTSITGSAAIQMRRGLTYRAGQGSLCRMTSIFGPPVADTYQLTGFGNVECGFYFGYRGLDFGVHHFTGGYREVRALAVTVGVAGGTSVTVTLNGEPKTVTINGNSNIYQTSWEIAQQDWTQTGGGWVTETSGSTVYFVALRALPRNGTYSATGAGLTATFSTFQGGISPTPVFVSQSQWNVDTMDGNGPSRMVLDKTKGNVYQVGFQYLGYGNTRFAIEDPNTGQFQPCHMIRQANSRTTPVLKDPHLSAIWTVSNAGSTTSTHMTGASGAIFCEGEILRNIGPAFSAYAANADVDNAPEPVITIKANRVFGVNAGYGELDISTLSVSVPTTGAHYVVLRIYKNLRLTGPVNFTRVNALQSIASYDTAATGYTANQNTLVATYVIPFGGSVNIDLKGDNFFLSVGESLTVTAEASTQNATVAAALTWFEDQ